MAGPLTAAGLFETQREKLGLVWLAGRAGAQRTLQSGSDTFDTMVLAGHLDLTTPARIQILSTSDLDNLRNLEGNAYRDVIARLFSDQCVAIILAQESKVTDEIIEHAELSATPLFSSVLPGDQLLLQLQNFLSGFVAVKTTMHGVFLEVLGAGVLITGPSGIGKSELALELVSRGHRLIADDVTEFYRADPVTVRGSCPVTLCDFLEVRGLGVLNIRAMFGDSAIKRTKNLRLIICLKQLNSEGLRDIDRLRGSQQIHTLLNVDVPQVTLPVAPGRNLAVLVEAAVRNHVLTQRGYDASEDFIRKQQQSMAQDNQ